MKIAHLAISLPVLACLVSWSPPDDIAIIGPLNETAGYSEPGLNVGPFNGYIAGRANQVGTGGDWNDCAAIIGKWNKGNLKQSIVAGQQNQFATTGNLSTLSTYMLHSGVFGSQNILSNNLKQSLITGRENTVSSESTLVSGSLNTVGGANVGDQAFYSVAIGFGNQIASSRASTIGYTNTVTGTWGVAIGSGLTASVDHSTALGTWNAPMGPDDLLVVGNGTDDSNRSTALTILNNGAVIIPGEVTHSGNTHLAAATTQSLTVSGNVSLQGTTTAQNLTVSGNSTLQGSITADDFNSTGTATLTDLDATTLDVTGTTNLADLNATGTTALADTTATTFTTSGTTALADTTAQTLTVSGATVLEGPVILAAPQGDISMGIYAP